MESTCHGPFGLVVNSNIPSLRPASPFGLTKHWQAVMPTPRERQSINFEDKPPGTGCRAASGTRAHFCIVCTALFLDCTKQTIGVEMEDRSSCGRVAEGRLLIRNCKRQSWIGLNAAGCDQVEFVGALQCAVSAYPHRSLECSKGLSQG